MPINRPAALFLAIGLLYASTAQALVAPDPGGGRTPKTYAILVGSHAPSYGNIDALRGDVDVDNVASQLSWASDVQVLKYDWLESRDAVGEIGSAVSTIASKILPGDSFIFYYSGHGTGGPGPDVQDFLNPLKNNAVQDNTLASAFAGDPFSQVKKFFLIDCCHAEGIWKNDSEFDNDLETLSNISFLGSSSEDGTAYTNPSTGTSYFTNAILPELTPNTTFGNLLMSAMSANGNSVTGFFKDDGYGTGKTLAVGYTSANFNPNVQLNGQLAVPEPAAFILLLAATAMGLLVRYRRKK